MTFCLEGRHSTAELPPRFVQQLYNDYRLLYFLPPELSSVDLARGCIGSMVLAQGQDSDTLIAA